MTETEVAVIGGGASGLTGGSVPMRRRSVIVRTTRFTKMSPVDHENMSVTLDAGVITQAAIDAVAKEGFLFTVDPAYRVTEAKTLLLLYRYSDSSIRKKQWRFFVRSVSNQK